MKHSRLASALFASIYLLCAPSLPATTADIETRVQDLLTKLMLDEKLTLIEQVLAAQPNKANLP